MVKSNPSASVGSPKRRSRPVRRRSLAAVASGITLGAMLTLASGLTGILPGLGSAASAASVLHGKVYRDTNRNGVQDPPVGIPELDENNVAGVSVTAYSLSGTVSGTAVTALDGTWSLSTSADGPFRVEFTNYPAPYTSGNAAGGTSVQFPASTSSPINFSLLAKVNGMGQIEHVVNLPVEIGDRVWRDANGNGVQDPGEAGIPGVVIQLIDNGAVVAMKTTDVNGTYSFGDLFLQHPYCLAIDPLQGSLSGLEITKRYARDFPGASALNDSNGTLAGNAVSECLTTAGPGENDHTFDFGFVPTAPPVTTTTAAATTTTSSAPDTTTTAPLATTTTAAAGTVCVGDYVWSDLNRNGVQDVGEPGVQGVRATLFRVDGSEVLYTVTDSNGAWGICGVTPGSYFVRFTGIPSGTAFTTVRAGGNTAKDSDPDATGTTPAFAVGSVNVLTIDAGIVAATSTVCVGDFVWSDLNGNGVQDVGEPGVQGVRATLFRADGSEVLFTVTDSNGAWTICGVMPGSYFVRFTGIPSGTAFTLVRAGSNPGTDSDPDATGTTPVFAVGTVNVLTIDAGLVIPSTPIVLPNVPIVTTTTTPVTTTTIPPGCIGDKVFKDPGSAKDGAGIPGVTVSLKRSDGSTLSTVTDANGNYLFCLLPPGTYTVVIKNPPVGSTNSYDLDGNKDNAATVAIGVGQSNVDVDFGYVTAKVLPEVITQTTTPLPPAPAAPVGTPVLSYTGARSTFLALRALTFLLVGYGIFGLTGSRRRRVSLR